jgi:hypothetical protein
MKRLTSFTLNLAAAALIVLASATVAAATVAGEDTCVGLGADIGGTCIPLINSASGNNENTAFGVDAPP